MEKESEFTGIWITAEISKSKYLTSNEKIIYSVIESFNNQGKLCFASNGYLAELINLDIKQVSDIITSLVKKGFISREVKEEDGNRRILTAIPAVKRVLPTLEGNKPTHSRKKKNKGDLSVESRIPLTENSPIPLPVKSPIPIRDFTDTSIPEITDTPTREITHTYPWKHGADNIDIEKKDSKELKKNDNLPTSLPPSNEQAQPKAEEEGRKEGTLDFNLKEEKEKKEEIRMSKELQAALEMVEIYSLKEIDALNLEEGYLLSLIHKKRMQHQKKPFDSLSNVIFSAIKKREGLQAYNEEKRTIEREQERQQAKEDAKKPLEPTKELDITITQAANYYAQKIYPDGTPLQRAHGFYPVFSAYLLLMADKGFHIALSEEERIAKEKKEKFESKAWQIKQGLLQAGVAELDIYDLIRDAQGDITRLEQFAADTLTGNIWQEYMTKEGIESLYCRYGRTVEQAVEKYYGGKGYKYENDTLYILKRKAGRV